MLHRKQEGRVNLLNRKLRILLLLPKGIEIKSGAGKSNLYEISQFFLLFEQIYLVYNFTPRREICAYLLNCKLRISSISVEGIRERISPKSVTSQSNPLIPSDMRTLEFTLSIFYHLRGLKPHLMVDKDEISQFGGFGEACLRSN